MAGLGLMNRRRAIQSAPTKLDYIRFADAEVANICIANFSSNGIAVSLDDAASVTSSDFGVIFRGNSLIKEFLELRFFTGLDNIPGVIWNSGAFSNCSNLTKIVIPASVTQIKAGAFYNCVKLNTIVMESVTPPVCGDSCFYKTAADLIVYVPDASLSAYQSASASWNGFTGTFAPLSTYNYE